MIVLRPASKDKIYNTRCSTFSYYARHNKASGKVNVYDLYILTADDPITIGREIDLHQVRELIEKYEAEGQKKIFYGDRRSALKIVKIVQSARYIGIVKKV